MASYVRQSTFADGDLITAALFNNEYNQLVSAFDNATGHKHDGTVGEGPVISVLGDAGLATPLNKILVDTTNDHIEFYIDVSGTSTQQLYIADGAIVPTINNDVDLGTSALKFKDLYLNGTANITGNAVVTGNLTVEGTTVTLNTATLDVEDKNITLNYGAGDTSSNADGAGITIQDAVDASTDATILWNATNDRFDFSHAIDVTGSATVDGLTSNGDITVNAENAELQLVDTSSGNTTSILSNNFDTTISADGRIFFRAGGSNDNIIQISSGGDISFYEETGTTAKLFWDASAESLGIGTTSPSAALHVNGGIKLSDNNYLTWANSNTRMVGQSGYLQFQIAGSDSMRLTPTGLGIGTNSPSSTLDVNGTITYGSLSDGTITITGFVDEDNMSSNSATLVPTQQSVKAYVDSQVGTVDTLSEILANGNTTGGTDIAFGDNDKAIFGTGSDLSIYHNGAGSFIDEQGTGGLVLRGTNLFLRNSADENYIGAISDGSVTLYHNNLPKLATTSTGIDVTGTVTSDGLTLDGTTFNFNKTTSGLGGIYFNDASNNGSAILSNGSNAQALRLWTDRTDASNFGYLEVVDGASAKRLLLVDDSGDISFYDDTGTTQGLFWDASTERLGIGTTSPSDRLSVDGNVSITTGGNTNLDINHGNVGMIEFTDTSISAPNQFSIQHNYAQDNDFRISRFVGGQDFVIDSSGNVGIGTSSPVGNLHIHSSTTESIMQMTNSSTGSSIADGFRFGAVGTGVAFINREAGSMSFSTSNSERMRLDSSGELLVAKTSADNTTAGHRLSPNGFVSHVRSGNEVMILNRLASDGNILTFRKDGATVGGIGTNSGNIYLTDGARSLIVDGDTVKAGYSTGGVADGVQNLGSSSVRWKDLHLSGVAYTGDIEISDATPLLTLKNSSETGRQTKIQNASGITKISARNNASNGVIAFEGYTASATQEYGRFDASGNFGIGTTSPGEKLQVDGNIRLGPAHTTRMGTDGTNAYFENFANGAVIFRTNNYTERMRINSSGNVGIGTASPSNKLEVNGNIAVNTSSGNNGIKIITGNTAEGFLIFGDAQDNSMGGMSYNNSTNSLSIDCNNSEAIRIDSSQRVGIGTTSPSTTLHVDGDALIKKNIFSSGDSVLKIQNGGNTGNLIDAQVWNGSAFETSFVATQSGNVGIGTDSPDTMLHLSDTLGNAVIRLERNDTGIVNGDQYGAIEFEGQDANTDASGVRASIRAKATASLGQTALTFSTASNTATESERMRIAPGGYVGIGTDSPNEELHLLNSGNTTLQIQTSGGGTPTLKLASPVGTEEITANVGSVRNMVFRIGGSERARFDNNGQLGIGTSSPSSSIDVFSSDANIAKFTRDLTTDVSLNVSADNDGTILSTGGVHNFRVFTNSSESARITSSGELLLNKTSASVGTDGVQLRPSSYSGFSATSTTALFVNRNTNDGDVVEIGKNGVKVGSLGTYSGNPYIESSSNFSLMLASSDIRPRTVGGTSNNDGTIDLGVSSSRFRDLHLSGTANVGSGLQVGSIGNIGNSANDVVVYSSSAGHNGLRFHANGILPTDNTGAIIDNDADLGFSTYRFKDLHLSGTGYFGTSVGIGTTSPETPLHVSTAKSSVTDSVLTLQDTTETFGKMIEFVGQGSTDCRGIIGFQEPEDNAPELYIANGGVETSGSGVGLAFWSYITVNRIIPCDNLGALRDNAIDLGSSSARFDDIYATNGTIQTSDRNDKQDIQALTDAEQRVATACKGLLRRFRWQDAVTEKGDEARYHFGIISQDLQDAFTAEGLDAGDYGMFISQTWEDSEGVEQTRLGVRYSELLAFIIAAI